MPLYDRELATKFQVFDWLYSSVDILNQKHEEGKDDQLTIGSWDAKIKQAEVFLDQLKHILASSQ